MRQLEDLVAKANEEVKQAKAKPSKEESKSSHLLALEEQMQEYFGTTTKIHQRGNKGKIEIEFLSESDLIRILDLLDIQL